MTTSLTLDEFHRGVEAFRRMRETLPLCCQPLDRLTPNRTVLLLLDDDTFVEGWLATHLRCNPRTFWTWDPRFAKVTNFVIGQEPRFLPGNVEPVAWSEMLAGAA